MRVNWKVTQVRRKLAQEIILVINAIVTMYTGITKFAVENVSRCCS